MTTSRWPDHLIGLEEWHALPEDTSRRFELVEGVLSVAPRPSPRHQRLGGATPTVRVPDVVVLHSAAVDGRPRVVPADVLAVVEVLSPGSHRTDRVTKLAEYAEAGIARYAILDDGPPLTLTTFLLDGSRYRQEAVHRGNALVDLGVPVPLALDEWNA
jgi:Uma2 family endonuclease